MSKNRAMWWIAFYSVLFFIGVGLAYGAYSEFSTTRNLLAKGIKTFAIVKDFNVSSGDNGPMYAPIFEFKDRSQNIQVFESGIDSSPPAYKIGDKVKIIYNPLNVENVKTISFWGLYRGSVILSMIAAPLLIIGFSYLLYVGT
ncbi:DUF3592 domain-containing protein [Maribacter sp. X9]|uniref:DUF3592 domain-containing protein n=1 Tax=Maribacter sp. X9 TaxID=3402159 RepID=UPI003AF3E71B